MSYYRKYCFLFFKHNTAYEMRISDWSSDVCSSDLLDLIELHDCFATAEILHYENLGLCERGGGGALIDSGDTALGGRIPVNVSGGLLSTGHPLGATGIAKRSEEIGRESCRESVCQ